MTAREPAPPPPPGAGGVVDVRPMLVVHQALPHAHFTTGMSVYPVGSGAPLHSHNCDEHVTILEGEAEVVVDGAVTKLERFDTTYVPSPLPHLFRNVGDRPLRPLRNIELVQDVERLLHTGLGVLRLMRSQRHRDRAHEP